MTNQVINLKNMGSRHGGGEVGAVFKDEEAAEDGFAPLLEWSAREYEPHPYNQGRYLVLGAIAALLIILGVFQQSYFFVVFILMASLVFWLYERKEAELITFIINEDGIMAGKKQYLFRDCKSFWIFNSPAAKELSIERKKALSSRINIPLGDVNQEKLREVLGRFIPEEEHEDYVIDQIARSI